MLKRISQITLTVLLLLSFRFSNAQTVSSKIMDARIDWIPTGGSYTGNLSVYLTDTIGIAGIKVLIGSNPDDSDLYNTTQTIDAAGHFSVQGSLSNNVLQTSIGTFTHHVNYYAKLSIMLDNSAKNEIAIHSGN